MTAPRVGHAPAPLLTTPEACDVTFVATAFANAGLADVADALVGCRVARIAAGHALMSRVYRVELTYRRAVPGAPRSLVLKLATDDPVQLLTAQLAAMYPREVLVYSEVAATLPYRTPRCFHAAMSADGATLTLLLEDLAPLHACDQLAGLAGPSAARAVDALADQHARFRDDPRLAGWAPTLWPLTDPAYPLVLPALFDEGYAVARRALVPFPTDLAAFCTEWATHCAGLLARLGSDATLVHGDWRADNLFLGPDAFVATDFQITGIGAGAYDLAYFVSQSMDLPITPAAHEAIVARYVARRALAGAPLALEDAWESYRVALAFCLAYPIILCRGWADQTPRGQRLIATMARRAGDAIRATHALEVL